MGSLVCRVRQGLPRTPLSQSVHYHQQASPAGQNMPQQSRSPKLKHKASGNSEEEGGRPKKARILHRKFPECDDHNATPMWPTNAQAHRPPSTLQSNQPQNPQTRNHSTPKANTFHNQSASARRIREASITSPIYQGMYHHRAIKPVS